MTYTCPLCGQPVSRSLYHKITGIWGEQKKLLKRVEEQRARLLRKFNRKQEELRKQTNRFRKEKRTLVREAVDEQTKRLRIQLATLKNSEKQIKRNANERIEKAIVKAETRANRRANRLLNSMKKQLRTSVTEQIRREKERTAQQVKRKYERLDRTFKSTLSQMRTKNADLKKQARQIRELEKQLERQTTPQMEGLLCEDSLIKELRKSFPNDEYLHTGKGGDVIQNVMQEDRQVGVIVYECKRVKSYAQGHLKQTLKAKQTRQADFAVLVTNAMKKGTHGFFSERGVMVVYPTGCLSLVNILRGQIVQIAEMKLSRLQKDEAIRLTMEYLQGPEFANSMQAIVGESVELYNSMMDEIEKHIASWKKRYNAYKKVCEEALAVKNTSKALLTGDQVDKSLIKESILPPLLALPDLEKLKTLTALRQSI